MNTHEAFDPMMDLIVSHGKKMKRLGYYAALADCTVVVVTLVVIASLFVDVVPK